MNDHCEKRTIELEIDGMTCSGCVPHVEASLGAVEGVTSVDVRFPERSAAVTVEAGVEATAIVGSLAATPYSATPIPTLPSGSDSNGDGSGRRTLAVLGGGSAGFAAAIRAVEAGARVVMINDGTIGGTCVNVGCVPSKTLIRAAETRHRQQAHPFEGVGRADAPVDWHRVRQGKDDLVGALRRAKYEEVLAAYPEIELVEGRGTLDSEGRVHLGDGEVLEADAVVVATGSSPWIPAVPGLDEAGYVDSTDLLDIEELPESLAVLGAGSVGLELAQAYARLGVRVTVLARSQLLSKADPDVGEELARHLRAEGIDVRTGVSVTGVERGHGGKIVHLTSENRAEDAIEVEEILVAAGRRGNTVGIGLAEAGVSLGEAGEVLVDEAQRTAHPRVFAAGDVTGHAMHVYVAAKAGSVAAENALGGHERTDLTVLPQVVFTDPGVAWVGMTEREARDRGHEPMVSKLALDHVPRALAARDTRGFIKLVADARSRRILGAHILAPEAGEMIMEPAMAIRFGLSIEDITSLLHPYLTLSEGIKLAALTFDKDVGKLSCCAV